MRSVFLRTMTLASAAVVANFVPARGISLSAFDMLKKKAEEKIKESQPLVGPKEYIDNSLDPDRYFVGGGDMFTITLIEYPSEEYEAVVNSSGDLYISGFGIVPLGRIPLRRAIEKIARFVQTRLKKSSEVYVALSQVKNATVTVSGRIGQPGTYRIEGSRRIIDALKTANRDIYPDFAETNYREVVCRNGDSVYTCDLLPFIFGGRPLELPYLYPGDHIYLAPLSNAVYFWYPGMDTTSYRIPVLEEESLAHFLSSFTFRGDADLQRILYMGAAEKAGGKPRIVDMAQAAGITLSDGDIVTVSRKQWASSLHSVSVKGEVLRPGVYPIVKNVSTAADVLELCGGPNGNANMERAVIIRHAPPDTTRGKKIASTLGGGEDLAFFTSLRPGMSAAFSTLKSIRDYTIVTAPGGDWKRVILRHNDRIIVPGRDPYVYVSGSVKRPGAVAYAAGKDHHYYLIQAGGFMRRADRRNLFAVRRIENVYQIKDVKYLEQGDILVVPDAEEFKVFARVVLPFLSMAATTISVILGIVATMR